MSAHAGVKVDFDCRRSR